MNHHHTTPYFYTMYISESMFHTWDSTIVKRWISIDIALIFVKSGKCKDLNPKYLHFFYTWYFTFYAHLSVVDVIQNRESRIYIEFALAKYYEKYTPLANKTTDKIGETSRYKRYLENKKVTFAFWPQGSKEAREGENEAMKMKAHCQYIAYQFPFWIQFSFSLYNCI